MKKITILRLDDGASITHEPEDDGHITLQVRESDDGLTNCLRFNLEEFRALVDWLPILLVEAWATPQHTEES